MSKNRKIRDNSANTSNKIKVTEDNISKLSNIDYPIFCFRYLHKHYNIDNCSNTQKVKFIKRLCELSKVSWKEIQFADKHSIGTEKMPCTSLKNNLQLPSNFITPDIKHLLVFRYDNNIPFLGHKSSNLFHVIYIAKNYKEIYNH